MPQAQEQDLNRSVYRRRGGREYKSCPRCSVERGRLVFHLLKDYGERRLEGGKVVPQSWCRSCRNKGGRHAQN